MKTQSGTPNDDVIEATGEQIRLSGLDGDDTLYGRATKLSGIFGGDGNDSIHATKTGFGQFHLYGADGDDTFTLDATNKVGWGHHTHHVYGGAGADTFDIVNAETNKTLTIGRIDDFDPNEDAILVDGTEIDLHDLPENMRVVSYMDQQWLQIGDHALFALDGARVTEYGRGPEKTERHFNKPEEDLWSLPEVEYSEPNNFLTDDVIARVHADRSNLNTRVDRIDGETENAVLTRGTNEDDYILSDRFTNGTTVWTDEIYGQEGNDVIEATKGWDNVFGGSGSDVISGGQGNDTLLGETGSDLLFGGTEDDLLFGDEGNDELSGDAGNDTLYGGEGNDTFTGGAGEDVFVSGAGKDVITDFELYQDQLWIDGFQFGYDDDQDSPEDFLEQHGEFKGDDLVISLDQQANVVLTGIAQRAVLGEDPTSYAAILAQAANAPSQTDEVDFETVEANPEEEGESGLEMILSLLGMLPLLLIF